MTWYNTIDIYNTFISEESYWFADYIQAQLTHLSIASYDSISDYIAAIIPYEQLCWMPYFEEEDYYEHHHPFHRKSTQCSSCFAMKKIFIKEIPELIVTPTKLTKSIATLVTLNGVYCITANPWVHNIITRCALNEYVKSVLYAYICHSTGILIEQKTSSKKNVDIEAWLDVLEAVQGFLLGPSDDLFDKFNNPYNLECLCWTWPDTPNVRWIGTVPYDPKINTIPWIYNSHSLTLEPGSWSEYYHHQKIGMNVNGDKMSRKDWNRWMTICSLSLEKKKIPPKYNKYKTEWSSPIKCIEWVMKQ